MTARRAVIDTKEFAGRIRGADHGFLCCRKKSKKLWPVQGIRAPGIQSPVFAVEARDELEATLEELRGILAELVEDQEE